jgi:O-antigen/teichoic acid export membrane protein
MPDSITKTVAKNTFWLLIGNMASRIMSLLIVIILARSLGDIQFGKFSFAQSFVQLFIIFMDLGVGFLIIREIARSKQETDKFINNAFLLRLILALLVSLLIAVSINLLHYPKDTKTIVYLLTVYFIFVSFNSLFSSVFMAYEKMQFNFWVSLAERASILLLCLLLLFFNARLYIPAVGIIYCLGGLLSLTLAAIFLKNVFSVKLRPALDVDFCLSLVREALPIAVGSVLVMLYFYGNTVILSKLKGDQAVGWYSGGFYLAYYSQLIPGAFLGAAYPLLSRLFKESAEKFGQVYQKCFELMLAFGLLLSLGGYSLADRIIPYFFGDKYINSILVFKILISGTFFFCVNSFFGHFLVAANRQADATKITLLAVLLNFCIGLILIGPLSYVGVGIALLVSNVLVFIVALVYFYQIKYRLTVLRPFLKALLAGITMTIVLHFFIEVNPIALIFIGLIVFLGALLLLRYFSRQDMQLIKNLWGYHVRTAD